MNKPQRIPFIVLSLILISASTAAQGQNCQKSQADLDAVRAMQDFGFDVAIVVSPNASIRAEPHSTSRALLGVKRNETLALVKRESTRTWFRVIEVDSATEGWINDCDVILKFTENKDQGPPLEQERAETTDYSELSVSNLEPATDLNLRLNGTLYVIARNSTKTFTLRPGRYDFYGYSPGVRPAFGGDNFKSGIRYRWTFQIVRR